MNGSHVVVCDINKEMLKIGRKKACAQGYKTGKSYRKCREEMLICLYNKMEGGMLKCFIFLL